MQYCGVQKESDMRVVYFMQSGLDIIPTRHVSGKTQFVTERP